MLRTMDVLTVNHIRTSHGPAFAMIPAELLRPPLDIIPRTASRAPGGSARLVVSAAGCAVVSFFRAFVLVALVVLAETGILFLRQGTALGFTFLYVVGVAEVLVAEPGSSARLEMVALNFLVTPFLCALKV